MTRRRFELTDEEWVVIEPLLPNKVRSVPRVDDRRVINGILRRASPWADIPERYAPYDSDAIRSKVEACGCFANIPAKRNRRKGFAYNKFLYRYRNLIERFFGKLKYARGLATRYDKRADNFLAAVKLFCTRLWIAANESTA